MASLATLSSGVRHLHVIVQFLLIAKFRITVGTGDQSRVGSLIVIEHIAAYFSAIGAVIE